MIDDLRAFGEWKIRLTMKIKNMSSRYSGESQPMNYKSNNIEIMIGNDTSEIINEALVSFLLDIKYVYKHQWRVAIFFFFDIINEMYCKYHRSLNRGDLYIDTPCSMKNKKQTTNQNNNDDKCFQFAVTAALNHENIENHPEYQKLGLL